MFSGLLYDQKTKKMLEINKKKKEMLSREMRNLDFCLD